MSWIVGLAVALATPQPAVGDPAPSDQMVGSIEEDLDRLAQSDGLFVVNRKGDGTRSEKRVRRVKVANCLLTFQTETLPDGGIVVGGALLSEGSAIRLTGASGEIEIHGQDASSRATIRAARSADMVMASLQAVQRKCAKPAILFPAPGDRAREE
ncbi:hypothetical protein FHS96_000350 [Sphingomonas zeicaulis]|uniref:hypothetical protein n=1 Tax=Sphingomonas zeicaulis TaxID=1632740 RepID=UPI003D1AF254